MKLYFIIFISLSMFSCNINENIAQEDIYDESFPVLTYDSEISETLSLDLSDIYIADSKELFFWSKSFQNVNNNIGNIKTSSTFKKKEKLLNSNGDLINAVQPVYFNENLCALDSKGILKCLNTSTNKVFFEVDTKHENLKKLEIIRGGIAYFDEKIVLVDAYGHIKLFDVNTQQMIWSNQIEFSILSAPLIYRNLIYFVSSDNRVFAINFDTGDVEWSFQTTFENKKNLTTPSPAAFENLIIVPFSNGELIAFKYDDGQPVWSENVSKVSLTSNFDIKDIVANPVVSGSNVFTISTNGKLISTNIFNGTTNWSVNISGNRTPVVSGNIVLIIDKNSRVICLNKIDGEIFWITELEKFRKGNKSKDLNQWLGPYLVNGLIYNISYFGELIILSPKTGEILAYDDIKIKKIITQPIIIHDAIYASDEKLNVFRLK